MTTLRSALLLRIPASLRILISPGFRTHTTIFTSLTLSIIAIGLVGKEAALSQTWTIVFLMGSALAFTYAVIAPSMMSEKIRGLVLYSKMKTRMAILTAVYGIVLGGLSYWTWQAGSVEAIPIFPAFIGIFYLWIVLQSYLVVAPVTHLLGRVEEILTGGGSARKIGRTIAIGGLFFPIVPLTYAVWSISTWLSESYGNLQGAGPRILLWSISVLALLFATFLLVVKWSWSTIRLKPQVAVFTGGTFGLVWAYLLYKATTILVAYVSQVQGANALLDIGLMLISVLGAIQALSRKIIRGKDNKLSQIFPFIIFSFGAIYAVSQLYFIIQIPITRIELWIAVNATVLVSGLLTMLLLIRRHLAPSLVSSPHLRTPHRELSTGEAASTV